MNNISKIFIFAFLIALILNYFKTEYNYFYKISSKFASIPKLNENYVPQGLSYFNNWIVISYYSASKKPSILVLLDKKTGKYIKYLNIYFSNGKPYTGHAGGVAVSKKFIWISSDYHLYKIKIDNLINTKSGNKINIIETYKIPVRASFVQYYNNHIWVGEFYHVFGYLTDPSHRTTNKKNESFNSWITGFLLDKNENISSLKYILASPNIVQDVEFTEDYIILSRSYGINNDSKLEFYPNMLNKQPQKKINNIPVWFLDNPVKIINILPMSEGISKIDNSLYILFESGALKYKNFCKSPTEYIWKLNLETLLKKEH
ncbi:hypothetical protein HNP65_001744 [Thermosipho japonicus]|uniref:Uncharacterized protein n=1 Tax=Thermosipho japonicus TaxID=90323 RepID=A0A841GUL5_9BACT|nr:hypothetical protein [Thermosipho japonicus]MBB6063280.1 hypothetical protein [Thermosipho japonicus]